MTWERDSFITCVFGIVLRSADSSTTTEASLLLARVGIFFLLLWQNSRAGKTGQCGVRPRRGNILSTIFKPILFTSSLTTLKQIHHSYSTQSDLVFSSTQIDWHFISSIDTCLLDHQTFEKSEGWSSTTKTAAAFKGKCPSLNTWAKNRWFFNHFEPWFSTSKFNARSILIEYFLQHFPWYIR